MLIAAVCLPLTACTRRGDTQSAALRPRVTSGQVVIEFHSEPDPPRSGDNTFEVTVKQPDGSPVTDATVTAVFSMPAMPSMNMPEMRSHASLTHMADGTYRGNGQLAMGGTWNVSINVSRGTEPLGTSRFSMVAK